MLKFMICENGSSLVPFSPQSKNHRNLNRFSIEFFGDWGLGLRSSEADFEKFGFVLIYVKLLHL